MSKETFNRIITLFLLVIIIIPISLQFIHSFETHSFNKQQAEDIEYIQNIKDNCAVYHQKINHNTIDLHFDFVIKISQTINQDIQIILVESYQCYTSQKSSRAPPISFV